MRDIGANLRHDSEIWYPVGEGYPTLTQNYRISPGDQVAWVLFHPNFISSLSACVHILADNRNQIFTFM